MNVQTSPARNDTFVFAVAGAIAALAVFTVVLFLCNFVNVNVVESARSMAMAERACEAQRFLPDRSACIRAQLSEPSLPVYAKK